jgi:hypothetical protein
MKIKSFRLIVVLTVLALLLVLPTLAFAAEKESAIQPLSSSDTCNNIPPADEISSDTDYSEGFVMTRSTVGGYCSIAKRSSSSVEISGTTTCSPSAPGVKISLKLQAYYAGAWHTLATKIKVESGTSVSLSQTYNVTTGYYYRVYATHSISDGSTTYSNSNGILVN